MNKVCTRIILASALLIGFNTAKASPECTLNANGEITDTTACQTVAQNVTMEIKGLWFCGAEPKPPTNTSSNPTGIFVKQVNNSGCSSRKYPLGSYNGSTGVTIDNGTSQGMPGGMSGVANTSTFGWVAMQLGPTIAMKGKYSFDSSREDWGDNLGGPVSTGTHCWTVGGTIRVSNSGTVQSKCGTQAEAEAGAAVTTYFFNKMGTATSYSWTMANGRNAKAYLLNAQQKLITASTIDSDSGVASIFVAIQNPITWYNCNNKNKSTKSLKLNWNVSQGMHLDMFDVSGKTKMNQFAPAAFDLSVSSIDGGGC